jgi:hypothetical protein
MTNCLDPSEQAKTLLQDMNWIALLFAISASGLQNSSTRSADERLACRSYGMVSFQRLVTFCFNNIFIVTAACHCLSLAQGFIRPTLNSIQSLIIIVQVLQNELFTEAAWNLVGLLSRQAQSLKLHVAVPRTQQHARDSTDLHRAKLW